MGAFGGGAGRGGAGRETQDADAGRGTQDADDAGREVGRGMGDRQGHFRQAPIPSTETLLLLYGIVCPPCT